jgi:hypothetical protein
MHILAIDPGASGGLAYGKYKNPCFVNMPAALDTAEGLIELLDLLVDVKTSFPDVRAVLELVGGFVGEAQPASSAFKFGASYASAKSMLIAARIPYTLVAPSSWQRHLCLPKRGRTSKGKTQHKKDLQEAAQALFPGRKITLKTADAALMFHLAHVGKLAV